MIAPPAAGTVDLTVTGDGRVALSAGQDGSVGVWDLAEGSQYLLFYRKDCEHCHELMEIFFAEESPLPTTAVAVPERAGFPTVGIQPFVCAGCRLAELPAGIDWFLKTPVVVRLSDGVVECAAEVTADDPICLEIY